MSEEPKNPAGEPEVKFPIAYYGEIPFEKARATGYQNGIYEITIDEKAMPEDVCDNSYHNCTPETRNPKKMTWVFQKQLMGVLDRDKTPVPLKDLPEQTRDILKDTNMKITLCLEHLVQMFMDKKL